MLCLRTAKIALLEIFVFVFCLLGIIQVYYKAGLPFQYYPSGGKIIINSTSAGFHTGDILLSINNKPVTNIEFAEFIMDGISPGKPVNLLINSRESITFIQTTAVHYYPVSYLIILILSGFSFFVIGVIIKHKGKNKKAARILYLVMLTTALTIICTWGNYNALPFALGSMVRIIFHVSYLYTPVLFFHFALTFPEDNSEHHRIHLKIVYIIAGIIFVFLSAAFLNAIVEENISSIFTYVALYNILRIFVLGGILASIIVFLINYLRSDNITERKKLKWLLLGFIIGPFCYVFLWIIPQAFQVTIIPESYILLLMAAVPVTFAISIIKYHILDVDLIINRSIVYTLLLIILGGFYFLIIFILTLSIELYYPPLPPVLAAFMAAMAFQPVRRVVQKFVDKKFFRVQYDYRIALNSFFTGIKEINTTHEIGSLSLKYVNTMIPLKEFAIALIDDNDNFYYAGESIIRSLDLKKLNYLIQLINTETVPLAAKNSYEPEILIKHLPNDFAENSIAMIFPIISEGKNLQGLLLAGFKKSGQRFSIEDSDLLASIALRISFEAERIKLQRQLITEVLEKERFEELDKLKSFFISGVSHELKTPITTIKMYSEILQTLKRNPEDDEYLNTIDGECDRLARLIDNLLDISRIERGEKKFRKERCHLCGLIDSSLKIIEYQRKTSECTIEVNTPSEEIYITGDPDALISAIVNLLTNAIKYSLRPKKIKLDYGIKDASAFISVSDNGPGISSEDIKNIMTPYYRTTAAKEKNISGTGIGLALVRHIIEGHNGTINISSSDKGASFTLNIPLSISSIKEIENEKSSVS